MMRCWIFILLFCVNLYAEQAKIKQATGSIIQQKGKIQTGPSSRIELELPYLAIVRIGSGADFRFTPNYKEMDLNKGTLMASMPKGSGDAIIRAGGVVATMAGNGSGTLEMSNVGGNAKLIVLSGKVLATLTKNPSQTKVLKYGQMLSIPTGTTTLPAISDFKLSELIKTSVLFNMGDFPGKRAVNQNATKQTGPMGLPFFVTGGFDPDWGGGAAAQTTIGPAGTASIVSHEKQQQTQQQQALVAQQQQALVAQQQEQEQQQQQAVLERNRQQAAQALALAAAVRAAQQRAAQEAAAQQAAQQASQAAQGQGQASQGQGQGSQGGSNPGNPNNGNQGNDGQGGGRPSQLPARLRPNPPIAKPM